MRRDWGDGTFPAIRRLQRAQKRLADGSLGGATNLASPVNPAFSGAPVGAARPAGGKQYATFVVAANDSTDAGKANADYVCDGVDDHLTIQEALDACVALPLSAGSVCLLEGSYTVKNTIEVSGVHLYGQGHRQTYVVHVAGGIGTEIIRLREGHISGMTVRGTGPGLDAIRLGPNDRNYSRVFNIIGSPPAGFVGLRMDAIGGSGGVPIVLDFTGLVTITGGNVVITGSIIGTPTLLGGATIVAIA